MTVLTPKQRLLAQISGFALSLTLTPAALAQVTITDAQTSAVQTDGEDTTIGGAGSITLEDAGPSLILNSDNVLINQGNISIIDVDNATGVELQSGPARSFTNSGTISVTETFAQEDIDGDGLPDGAFAEGTGRTGILISGASPFEGNIELDTTSNISIEGNDSFGINLSNTVLAQEGLTGNLSNAGTINLIGDNTTGINIASNINGDFSNNGTIQVQGLNAQGVNVDADIQGGFVNSGSVVISGFRSATSSRANLPLSTRELFTDEDLLIAGSALNINGNIDNGILLDQVTTDFISNGEVVLGDDGTPLQTLVSTSTITQFGSAPAVNIDGEGAPITIGQVAQITDPANEDFDANQQFSFVNEGSITTSGVFDDFDATGLQTADANFTAGINNSGTIMATAFRAPAEVTDVDGVNITPGDGVARAVALGSGTTTPSFTNSFGGILSAIASEPADLIFADRDNILAGRDVIATTVDIEVGANVPEFTNAGTIAALVSGREGTATAVLDSSDTLRSFTNTGIITAGATTSDALGEAETELNAVALDFSQSTGNITLLQERAEDANLDDNLIPANPLLSGDILLGSGDDDFTVTAGSVLSNLNFGGGADSFTLSGGSNFEGTVENAAGLSLNVSDGSSFTLQNTAPVNVANAVFEDTSLYRPVLNNVDGSATVLNASGDITFAAGSAISPILGGFAGVDGTDFAIAQAGGTLTAADLETLDATASVFLFDSNFSVDQDTLFVTFDLREPGTAVADGGLGLDTAQTAAFGNVIEALSADSALGAAFGNISEAAEFNSSFNQLLPEISAASRQFILASVDGAVGAVGNHLDSVRRSPEKGGGIWLQQYAYFADRELANLSEQFRGSGFGFTAGIDREFGNFHAIGANIGFSSTEIEDVLGVDEPLDVTTVQAGLYAGWATGRLGIEAYGGAGISNFEQNRNVQVNTFNGTAQGDWNGTHINGSLRAGYDIDLSEKFWIRPAASLDYLRLSEDSFTETGNTGITLAVDDRTSETASATGLINFGAKFQGKRTWIRPSLRAGIRHEFINDPVLTSFRFANLVDSTGTLLDSNTATIESAVLSDTGIILGFSVAAGSVFSSIGFDFDTDIRDDLIRHTGRVVIRLLF